MQIWYTDIMTHKREPVIKPGRRPELAKALAAVLAAAPATTINLSVTGIPSIPSAYATETSTKRAVDAYAEMLSLELDAESGFERIHAENRASEKIRTILESLSASEKFEFAKRVAEEFPHNVIGELLASQLLLKNEYKVWKKPGADWNIVKGLAERAPLYFIQMANDLADMPDAPTLVRNVLSKYAIAVSHFPWYNKVPGAVDILLQNIHNNAGVIAYNEIDALLSSDLISDGNKKRIRTAMPPRSKQQFLTILSLQNTYTSYVISALVRNSAFRMVDENFLKVLSQHLKQFAVPFGDVELAQWREHIIKSWHEGFQKKVDEAKVAMIKEVQDHFDMHPLQLMYRAAQVAQYLHDHDIAPSEASIKDVLMSIEHSRSEYSKKTIPKNAVVLTHNERVGGEPAMAQSSKLKAIEERVAQEGGTYVHVSGDDVDPVLFAKIAIVSAPAGLVLHTFMHGSPDGIYFRDGGQDLGAGHVETTKKSSYISPDVLADIFAERYRDSNKRPEDDLILSHACYQSDYARNFARAMAQRGFYIPLFAAPSEQGTTATAHATTPLGTKIEENWIQANTGGDLFMQEFETDPASHPSIFVPDTSYPLNKKRNPSLRDDRTPFLIQISGINTYQGVAIG